jgi:hypothetical protein
MKVPDDETCATKTESVRTSRAQTGCSVSSLSGTAGIRSCSVFLLIHDISLLVIIQGRRGRYGIDGLVIKLGEVLVLPLVCLVESGFDLCGPLVIALKPHLDLSSSSTIRDSLKLLKRKTQEKNSMSSAISIVPIFLILRDTSTGFKHNVGSILANLPNKPINPLEMCGHADLPIGVVCSIEEWWFP